MAGLKITYKPFEEIVVKERVEFEKLEDLIYVVAQLRAMGQPAALNWAEGVVFIHITMEPVTDELVEEFLKGRLYYIGVQFALMEKYKPVLTHKSPQGEISVPVINVSSSLLLSELAKWLKTHRE